MSKFAPTYSTGLSWLDAIDRLRSRIAMCLLSGSGDVPMSELYRAALTFVAAYQTAHPDQSGAVVLPDADPSLNFKTRLERCLPVFHLDCSRCTHFEYSPDAVWCALDDPDFPAICARYQS